MINDNTEHYVIKALPNSGYKMSMPIHQSFFGGLIGSKGQTIRRIQNETRTEIVIPRNNDDIDVIVKGKTPNSVAQARREIDLLLQTLRKRMKVTHFVEVPLNAGEIRENFLKLKEDLLAANLADELLFISEARIHVSLTYWVLLDEAEHAKAIELLHDCRQFLHDLQPPFNVKVSGLEIMNDDPSAVRVVFARIEAPELQIFADRCFASFLRSGLAKNEHERDFVRMHMTVLNNKYLRREKPEAPNSFDAREILKRFGDYCFGTAQINEIHLSKVGEYVEEEGPNFGHYKTCATLQF